jgi:hypothetical protein
MTELSSQGMTDSVNGERAAELGSRRTQERANHYNDDAHEWQVLDERELPRLLRRRKGTVVRIPWKN